MARTKQRMPVLVVVIIAILTAACLAIDCWYLYIKLYGDVKLPTHTYEVGLQKTSEGDTKYFVEIEYYSNENKNGLECFEIKFNYLLDERQENFYSQGLQLVADSKDDSIKLSLMEDGANKEFTHWNVDGNHYNRDVFYNYKTEANSKLFNYASGNDYSTTMISTNPLGDKSYFRIQLGEQLYLMKFKSSYRETRDPETYADFISKRSYSPAIYCWFNDSNYIVYDYTYFTNLLYTALSSDTLANGTQSAMLFEFGNIFDYYEYDESNKVYKTQPLEDTTKVQKQITSYYSIYVKKHADGMQKASQSLFNCVQGSSTFNMTEDYNSDDYFIGRTIVTVDDKDFDYIKVTNNYYKLQLKESFINEYKGFGDKIVLSVQIDLDELTEKNINFLGFMENSGLKNFEILECYTIQTKDGETVKTEVQIC